MMHKLWHRQVIVIQYSRAQHVKPVWSAMQHTALMTASCALAKLDYHKTYKTLDANGQLHIELRTTH